MTPAVRWRSSPKHSPSTPTQSSCTAPRKSTTTVSDAQPGTVLPTIHAMIVAIAASRDRKAVVSPRAVAIRSGAVVNEAVLHQVVKAYLARPPEIVTEDFPGYAPEANPDEGVWGWTKYHRIPNYAPEDTAELRSHLWHELSSLRERRDLLASFIRHAEIPIPLRV